MDFGYNDQFTYLSEYEISELLGSMEMKGLSWKKPASKYSPWVFWSHEQSETISSSSSSGSIALANTRKITSELYNYCCRCPNGSLLIQFWAATKTDGGGCRLTTRDQPFAIQKLTRGNLAYRSLSLTYEFVVNDDDDEEKQQLVGLPGRVFRNKWPESTPDVSYYSTTEYPQWESAFIWGIRGCLALPVFEPSGCDLLGVLELAGSFEDFTEVWDDFVLQKITLRKRRGYLLKNVAGSFEDFTVVLDDFVLEQITQLKFLGYLFEDIQEPASKEMQEVLEKVCDVHHLPLAQSWVLGNNSNTPGYNEIQENGDAMVVTNYAVRGGNKWKNFSSACQKFWLKKDQGIVGKALLSHKPCFCEDITQFSMTEYPLVHYARDCGQVGCFTICLRNFITGNKDYVLEFFLAPLEMGSQDPQTLLYSLLETLKYQIYTFKVASGEELGEELYVQNAGLRLPSLFAKDEMKVLEGLGPAQIEINLVLKAVCERHLLPLVQCWVRWSSKHTRDFLVLFDEEFCDEGTAMFNGFIFRKVQGLVGKTLLSRKPCFCTDVTHLSLNEYPFLNHARRSKLTRCFTICLRSTFTGDEDYILEFFLPPCNNEESEDPQIFLDSLFATMKENFESFKVASGEELGEELCVEVYKSFNDNEEESFRICQPKRSLSQPESLENEGEMMALDPTDQQLVVEDAIQLDGNVSGTEISDTICVRETSEIKNKRTVKDISYEDLEQHFGRRLIDVAKSFGLSQSTFKRLCRNHGIDNWRDHKRKTADNSSSKLRRVGEEPSTRELSCSGMPPVQSTSAVAHTSRDVYPVAVKAKYKKVIIRFELPSSSGIAELQENVTQRLQLEKRNFSIEYQDDEGDWVLIACDNDLKTCLDILGSSKKTPIKMSIGPKYSP